MRPITGAAGKRKAHNMSARMKVYFDGGCRPNPGAMEIAVVAAGHAHILRDMGHGSSADAEWLALIHAVRVAQAMGATDYVLIGDALSVIRAANGTVKCRGAAAGHLETFKSLVGACPPRIRHTGRSHNLAGIVLGRLHPR